LWANQSTADADWAALQGAVEVSTIPDSTIVKAIMGKDATGTVYFDNIGLGIFNGNAETIKGWMNWYASDNGSYGIVTDNAANTGSYSAELFKPDTTTSSSEIVYYSIPVPVEAGEWYKIGVWVKTEGVNNSSAFEPTYIMRERLDERIALCYFFHGAPNILESWDPTIGGDKFVYIDQTTPDKEWTHYVVAERAPDEATGISVRARFTSHPTGTAWFDDFSVHKMVVSEVGIDDDGNIANKIPKDFMLLQNYPNPFNPETKIQYSLPYRSKVTLEVYNILGQKIRTLVSNVQEEGYHTITWDGKNDFGNPASTGIYIYILNTGNRKISKKMALIR
jgi:hypothetical protein